MRPRSMLWRAEIVLFTAEGFWHETRSCVGPARRRRASGRWQERFMEEGVVEGLLRGQDAAFAHPAAGRGCVAKRIVALTQTDPPGETTHWTGAMMAKASGDQCLARCNASGARAWSSARTRSSSSSSLPIPSFVDKLRECGRSRCRSAGSRPSSCRLTRRAKSRRSIEPSPGLPMKKGARPER